MSADDTRAIQSIMRQQLLDATHEQVNGVWQALEGLPEEARELPRACLEDLWRNTCALVDLLEIDEVVLAESHALLTGLQASATKLAEQRDDALAEIEAITVAIKNHWMTDHPLVRPLYGEIMDAHNSAFWESLPYDMADVLGGDWDFIEADALYSALTVDLDEKEDGDEDYGYTREQLIQFRAALLQAVRRLQGG